MSMRTLTVSVALASTLLLGACRDPATVSGTSLFVVIDFDQALALTQFEVAVFKDDEAVGDSVTKPDAPGKELTRGQSLRLLLPDRLGGAAVKVRVNGFSQTASIAQGEATAVVRKGREVDVSVVLQKEVIVPTGCGAVASCQAGQQCIDGVCVCNPSSCPSGCCQGPNCVEAALASCGASGLACQKCDSARSDSCSAEGSCQCGSGASCAGGQRCVAGLCVCDASSCPSGCCEGASCRTRTLASCGAAASSCVVCDATLADTCSAEGRCRCGLNPTCAAGQTCTPDGCKGGSCDSTNCPDGCCAAGVCQARSFATCGNAGSACSACDSARAEACLPNGTCACGALPACAVGQRCLAGACVCDSSSCPTGCCQGGQCLVPSLSSCGTGGATCGACNTIEADTCSAGGSCTCGSVVCPTGQQCVGGSCGCGPGSCPSGCCSAGVCVSSTSSACGTAGSACVACDPTRSDQCTGGACRCGSAAACAAGQRCLGQVCVCDATSCPSGCCDALGQCSSGDTKQKCGTGGAACQLCAGAQKCQNKRCQ